MLLKLILKVPCHENTQFSQLWLIQNKIIAEATSRNMRLGKKYWEPQSCSCGNYVNTVSLNEEQISKFVE